MPIPPFGPGSFRLLLALLVVGSHLYPPWFFYPAASVYVFFVLSGYWISRLYDRKYQETAQPAFAFWLGRIKRLMPIFWVNLLLSLCAIAFTKLSVWPHMQAFSLSEWLEFLLREVLLLGYHLREVILLVPAWSLDVEAQFYLSVPLWAWLLGKAANMPTSGQQVGKWALIGLGIGCLVVVQPTVFRDTLMGYLAYFILGWLLYCLPTTHKKWAIRSAIFCVIVLLLHYLAPSLYQWVSARPATNYYHVFNFTLPLILLPFISWNVRQPSPRWDWFCGRLSYPIYLFHWPCVLLFEWANLTHGISKWAALPIFLLVLLVGSWAQVHWLDPSPFPKSDKFMP